MAECEVVIYNGVKFRRYPDAKQRPDRVYFNPGIGDRQKGVKRLHEEIWKAHNGPIPGGHHIHHKDNDPLNNDISNLECLTPSEHHGIHAPEHREWRRAHIETIRPLASEWHRSDEGRRWHSEMAKQAWKTRQPLERICDQCLTPFDSMGRRDTDRFCCNACKSAWRRDSGIDDVDRTCANCGWLFRVNKYAKTKTCSQSCAKELRWGAKTSTPSAG